MIMMSACDSSKTNPEKAANPSAPDGPVNPVVKTIMERRSIRSYKPEKVSRQEMDVILTCGINAPSAQNKQPWEVRVVDDPEFINGVTDIFKKQAEGYERMMKMVNDSTFKNMFRNAPTVVFVGCNDLKYATEVYNNNYNISQTPSRKIEFMHKFNQNFDYKV